MDDDKNVREAAAEDMSYELLTTLLMQVRMLPKPWDQMLKVKQDEVIESGLIKNARFHIWDY